MNRWEHVFLHERSTHRLTQNYQAFLALTAPASGFSTCEQPLATNSHIFQEHLVFDSSKYAPNHTVIVATKWYFHPGPLLFRLLLPVLINL